ncbi:MAG TPA: glycosyltransferase [Acetobacteraceae bacterium]|nr:glycosyltransferase [Acetobacteraceae bacterium]
MSRLATPAPQARSLAKAPPPAQQSKALALGNFLRKVAPLSAFAAEPPAHPSAVPPVQGDIRTPVGTKPFKVSIHVPVCNEPPEIVCGTLDALSRLDYPNFEVLVIASNTNDPALWEPVARHCARLGSRFRFFHLGPWPGFKAGALNFALGEAAPDAAIIGVIRSGLIVSSDWLHSMVPAFADPKLGFALSPEACRDNGETLLKRLMFWEQARVPRLGMMSRDGRDPIIAQDAMLLIRAAAIRAAGGWAEGCAVEETELGLRLMRHGWQGIAVRKSFGERVVRDDFASWRKQRFRQAYGAVRIGEIHWRALLSPFGRELSFGQRWRFLVCWLSALGAGLGLLFLLTGLAWSILLILTPGPIAPSLLPFILSSLGLAIFAHAGPFLLYRRLGPFSPGAEVAGAIAGLASSHTTGKAALWGLTAQPVPRLNMPLLGDAPWFVRGIVSAREEFCILLLTWAAMAGVVAVHGLANGMVKLWCLTLLIQSLPYVAAVAVSILAAMPAPPNRVPVEAVKAAHFRNRQ